MSAAHVWLLCLACACSGNTIRLGGGPDLDGGHADVLADTMDAVSPCGADLSSDSANCGACGHGCLGGTCAGGLCQPILLADNLQGPDWIAADVTSVYWTEQGDPTNDRVQSVAKDGTQLTLLSAEPGLLRGVAVDQTNVYWLRTIVSGNVGLSMERIAKSGLPSTHAQITFLNGAGEGAGVAVDSSNVYFSVLTAIVGAAKTATMTAPSDVVGNLVNAQALVLDSSTLFIADEAGSVYSNPATLVTTSSPKTLVGGMGHPTDVAIDATSAYAAAQGSVWFTLKGGGSPSVLAAAENVATGIAVDDTYVFWTAATEVKAVPKNGGTVEVRAAGFIALGRLVADATALYFTDTGGNRVWKLAK